jgi:peptide alpha-N-acetyltransferase
VWYGGGQVSLEVEYNNAAALRLYSNLGFFRTKLLAKYYLNGSDAYRMRLVFK